MGNTAATTRIRNPDTGALLGVPEASSSGQSGAITKYAPQWKLDGLAEDPHGPVGVGIVSAPIVQPIVHAAPAMQTGAPAVTPAVESTESVLSPVQQRMAKARAARGRPKGV